MKYLKSNINEYIQLYLNDLEDYGDDSDNILIAETVLNDFKMLLTESKEQDMTILLKEAIHNSRPVNRLVYKNFLEYLENI
jgi:hypothetical protein